MILRPYQQAAIGNVSAAHKSGARGVLLVMPTGAGKTVVFSRVCKAVADAGGVALVLVPRVELVDQTSDKLRAFGVRHGVIAASRMRPDPAASVQVAMVQTLLRRPAALLRRPSYIVIDEAHLSAADSYRTVLGRYPAARILGVTATPFRLDGQGFRDFAGALVVGSTVDDLTAAGSLVPALTYSVPVVDVATFKRTRNGEFDQQQQAAAYERQQLIGDVVAHYTRHAAGRRGIVFAASVKHALQLAESFTAAGLCAACVFGDTPDDDRRRSLGDLAAGRVDVVCNFGVLCEGFDCPPVSAIVVARATASKALWIQMAGRGLRPSPGKVDCVILDHGGNAVRHGGVAFRHAYSLDGQDKRERDAAEVKAKVCKACCAVMPPSAETCTVCGFPFVVAPRPGPQTVAGDLVLHASSAAPLDGPAGAVQSKRPWQARRQAADAFESWTQKLRRVS